MEEFTENGSHERLVNNGVRSLALFDSPERDAKLEPFAVRVRLKYRAD